MEVSSIRAEEMSDDETFDDAYDNHVSCRGRVPRGGLSPLSSSSDTHLSPSEDEYAAHENIVKSFNKPHSRKKKSKRPSVTPTFGVSSTSTANNANQDLMQDIINPFTQSLPPKPAKLSREKDLQGVVKLAASLTKRTRARLPN